MRDRLTKATISFLGGAALAALAQPALAQTATVYDLNLEAQPLDSALQSLGRTAGKEIMYAEDAVANRRAAALRGHIKLEAALKQLLRGTGLVADIREDVILIRSAAKRPHSGAGDLSDTDIVVTGSHIRGGETASPLTIASREQIEKRGFTDLGAFARDLPQNHAGGQNPTLAGLGQATSSNITGSSALNLRGLGPDATLTLFNGHRVSYDAMSQGIDISAIPLAAVERVEVVTDGSSALYGSDAVGGVANVILRRDYDGLELTGRFGAATDGGDVEQQYSLVGGRKWQTGGFMAALDYRHATPITAGQRSYTQNIHPSSTMLNTLDQYSAVLAGHQQLTDRLSVELDGHFLDRKNSLCTNFTTSASCFTSGNDVAVHTRSWSVSPQIKLDLDGGWRFRIGGTYSESVADQRTDVYFSGLLNTRQRSFYTNRLKSVEMGADGPLFSLPGGPAQLALGIGLRDVKFIANAVAQVGSASIPVNVFSEKQETYYAYGEASLPFIAPGNALPFVHRLTLTGALRYEDTPHVGRLATPKIGLVYAPVQDIAFKFSWGKSFKAPTLFQTGRLQTGASQLGSSYLPESPTPGTVLYLGGGYPDLKPEKATSWTATAVLTPSFIEKLRIEASYFHVKYKDRVVNPIPINSAAFNPVYAAYVTLNPSRAQVLAAIANLATISDQGGGDVTTANVVAIVSNFLQNAAVQRIEGLDVAADYSFDLSPDDKIRLNAAVSYLKSEQQLTISQPVIQLAGLVFQPPHWRGNGSVNWERGNVSLTSSFTFIGGSLDNRLQPYLRVGSYKSVDAVARIKTTDVQGPFAGISVTLSLLNILNEKPSFARTTSSAGYRYDSTNFPSIGRFVGLAITKAF